MHATNALNIVLIVSSGQNPWNPDRDFIREVKMKEWTIIIFFFSHASHIKSHLNQFYQRLSVSIGQHSQHVLCAELLIVNIIRLEWLEWALERSLERLNCGILCKLYFCTKS